MNLWNKISKNRSPLLPALVLAFVFGFCLVGGAVAAEKNDLRSETLERALATMWMTGFDDATKNTLESLCLESDVVSVKALFQLGCVALLQGQPNEAAAVLQRMERIVPSQPLAQPFIDTLKKYLASTGKNTSEAISLDVKELAIPEIIRILAAKTNRAIVVDEGVERRMITLHIPKVGFDEVMRILSLLGNFTIENEGEILVIRSRRPTIDQGTGGDGKISLDFSNADIRDVLRLVAAKGKFNLVFHKSVRGKITMRLQKVDPLEALRLLAKAGDYAVEKDGDSFFIMEAKYSRGALGGAIENAVIPLRFLNPKDALSLLNRERISGGEESSKPLGIFFKGDHQTLERVRKLLQEQDRPQKPILISTKIWEFLNPGEVDANAFAEKSQEEKLKIAKLVSAPRIMTLTGRSAKIEIDEKNDDKEVKNGVELSFEPIALPDGMFQVEIFGTIKTETKKDGRAVENIRKIQSVFVVKSGARFAYEVQGGILPTVIEVELTQTD